MLFFAGVFLMFLLMAVPAFSQTNKRTQRLFNEAKQQFSLQAYEQAKVLCFQILENDTGFVDARLLLADIYNATDSLNQEIRQLQAASKKVDMTHLFYRLGNAYYLTGQYQQALQNFKIYQEETNGNSNRTSEINRKLENCRFAVEALKNPVEFHPEPLSNNINTHNDEYWPTLSIDQKQLVFTRLIKRPGYMPQEDFFVAEFNDEGWGVASPIVEINTPENEGAQIVSADGRLLFFTACNRNGGKGSCDIYFSRWINNRWSAPRNAGATINSNYWEAQPGFSSDDHYLYFSSNRPGGYGNKDIWRAEFLGFDEHGNAKWRNPENLGDKINTEGNEISPFIHPNNKSFYFASDFHTGMGGSDVFMSQIKNDQEFSMPENLGYPINSFNNEQGLFISADGRMALFSSARNELSGLDIYSFKLGEELRPDPVTYLKAKVVDANTKKPVQALLELVNLTDADYPEKEETTDSNGEVLLVLPAGANYAFSVSKEDYLFFSESFALNDTNTFYDPYNFLIELKPIEIGSEMNLYNVYFETDSFRILPESEPELQRLLGFLQNNGDLKVEIQGHTDHTGGTESNQILSELRARAVYIYLTERGIDKERLSWKGYGELKPVASNETPEGRRQNRRTTIKILGE